VAPGDARTVHAEIMLAKENVSYLAKISCSRPQSQQNCLKNEGNGKRGARNSRWCASPAKPGAHNWVYSTWQGLGNQREVFAETILLGWSQRPNHILCKKLFVFVLSCYLIISFSQ
jgi:hypothetical protein